MHLLSTEVSFGGTPHIQQADEKSAATEGASLRFKPYLIPGQGLSGPVMDGLPERCSGQAFNIVVETGVHSSR